MDKKPNLEKLLSVVESPTTAQSVFDELMARIERLVKLGK